MVALIQSLENVGGKIYNSSHPWHKTLSGPAILPRKSYDFYVRGTGLMGWTYPNVSRMLAFFRGRLNGTVDVTNVAHDPFSATFVITLTPLKDISPEQICGMLVIIMNSYAGLIGHLGSFSVTDWEEHGTIKNGFLGSDWLPAAAGAGIILAVLLLLRSRI